MAGTSITQVQSLFAGNAASVVKGQDVQNAESFSKVFDKTQTPMEKQMSETNTKKTETTESIQNHAQIQKKHSSENLKGQTEETTDETEIEDVEKAMEAAAGMMVETIAETFDMTVEEVENVMEQLGLTAMDLLNGENLTQVVIALNPEADAFTIMTNEELFTDLKGLMSAAEELTGQLAEQFGMSQEELTAVADALKEQAASQTQEAAEPTSETKEIPVEIAVDMAEETSDTVRHDEVLNMTNKSDTANPAKDAQNTEQTVIPKTENRKENSKESTNDFHQNAASDYRQQVMNQLADAVENTAQTTTSYGVNGQDIIRQITDYIKIHVSTDTTEMELQLHPASLGNIKVQIASAGGVLTATFTTENEAVKAALEGQLIQLKENFEQQGLKVENVEVNVSAQGFERSLDQQEQGQQNAFDDKTNTGRSRNRRIRLNGLEEPEDVLTEEMSEGDRIVADMMLQNGNSVDYTV